MSASFCLVFCFLLCSSEALENITAVVGQEVTLPCKVNNNKPIKGVEWSRDELDLEYVLLYRDGHFDSFNQHLSYQNRTDLQDREMKNGDVSMILKDVKMEDRGTYECRVFQIKANRINTIYLDVGPSGKTEKRIGDGGDKDGGDEVGFRRRDGLIGSLSLTAVIVFIFVIRKTHVLIPKNT